MANRRFARALQKRNLFIAAIIIILAILFWSILSIQESFYDFVDIIQGFIEAHQYWGIAIFVGLAGLSSMLSPFSSIPLVPPAILIWGQTNTAILLAVGWFIGGIIAYALAYFIGYPLVNRIASFQKIEFYRQRLGRRAEFWIALLFRLGVPSELASYVFGIIRYPFVKYLVITAITEAVFAAITVSTGGAILEKNFVLLLAVGLGTLLLISAVTYLLHRQLGQKSN